MGISVAEINIFWQFTVGSIRPAAALIDNNLKCYKLEAARHNKNFQAETRDCHQIDQIRSLHKHQSQDRAILIPEFVVDYS